MWLLCWRLLLFVVEGYWRLHSSLRAMLICWAAIRRRSFLEYPMEVFYPLFKIFPKIHKNPISYRPLVDAYLSFNYFLAKFLLNLFCSILNSIPHNLPNATTLKQDLLTLPQNTFTKYTMYSLDIVSLYPSIPTDLAIDTLLSSDQIQNLTDIPNSTLKQMLTIATYTYFCFNNRFYEQTKGLAMGSSLSGLLASIFIYYHIESTPLFSPPQIIYYKRYVDDTILLVDDNDPNFHFSTHVQNINTIHPTTLP